MKFHPSTSAEEARELTARCLQVIASGWPVKYMKMSQLQGVSSQATAEIDVNAMISDAADIAASITQAVDYRLSHETEN